MTDAQPGPSGLPDDGFDHGGHLAENIAYFGRALRNAGLPVGPGAVVDAVEAVSIGGLSHREDYYATLHAIFVKSREHSVLFDQAFRLFWRRRALIEKMMAQMMPVAPEDPNKSREETLRRIADALFADQPPPEKPPEPRLDLDASMTVSDAEMLRSRDFEQMTAAEIAEAKRQIAKLVMPLSDVATRRYRAAPRGRIDARAMLRASLRAGGEAIVPMYKARATKTPPLVALCDISGSMSQYSRIFLHFLHALGGTGRKVHAFTFATELTNISRGLKKEKDPDIALAAMTKQVRDWDGGTRIGATLERFNKVWARRVLGQGAIVLLITDGLERRVLDDLPRELARLRRSCRRLIWLNPLLRFEGFEVKAAGIKAMLPHVDEFRTLHSLDSIADLCAALSVGAGRDGDPKRFLREMSRSA